MFVIKLREDENPVISEQMIIEWSLDEWISVSVHCITGLCDARDSLLP